MTSPFLSIVTISFNQGQYLRQCVDSVVSQKGKDVEYIVVDPGSTDGSREILQGYGDAIDHLVLEPDNGPADGLNKGFARATGEIGYFINSDDFLMPYAIDRMRQLWADTPDIDILLARAWMVDESGEPLRELVAESANLNALLSGDATVVQQGLSFQMSRFREVGGFNIENRTCWDFELLCAMINTGAIALLSPQRIGAFRISDLSLSGGVGGTAHTQRYLADLNRLHRELTGHRLVSRDGVAQAMVRIRRALSRPSLTMLRARDQVFPSRLRRRWEEDVGSSRVGR